MGSAPQQAGQPMSSNLLGQQALARILPQLSLNNPQMGQGLFGALQPQSQQPSGMAPPQQPNVAGFAPQSMPGHTSSSSNAAGFAPQSMTAPITQQLQQATQPGASGMAGDNFAGQMQQPLQGYYQNPLAMMLGGWRNG